MPGGLPLEPWEHAMHDMMNDVCDDPDFHPRNSLNFALNHAREGAKAHNSVWQVYSYPYPYGETRMVGYYAMPASFGGHPFTMFHDEEIVWTEVP